LAPLDVPLLNMVLEGVEVQRRFFKEMCYLPWQGVEEGVLLALV